MTRADFNKLHESHKRLWGFLAYTGVKWKPNWSFIYDYGCPACEADGGFNCGMCPIDKWRRIANDCFRAPCIRSNSLYAHWLAADDKKQRKIIAKQIQELEWSWNPIYATVELKKSIRDFLAKDESI